MTTPTNNPFESTTIEEEAKRLANLFSKVLWAGEFPPSSVPYTAKPIRWWTRVRWWIEAHRLRMHWGFCECGNCDRCDED